MCPFLTRKSKEKREYSSIENLFSICHTNLLEKAVATNKIRIDPYATIEYI